MAEMNNSPYKGSAQITRNPFLFYEMRTTAKLIQEGLGDKEIINRIVTENLFQYPTEKSIRQMAKACIERLKGMGDEALVEAVALQSSDTAKQICLYAMMKQYRLVWDFMITVIGEKYRLQDFSFGQMDVNVFFMRLQEAFVKKICEKIEETNSCEIKIRVPEKIAIDLQEAGYVSGFSTDKDGVCGLSCNFIIDHYFALKERLSS